MPSSHASILDAAAVEFAEHGFSGTRIEWVARRAGCNKALVYRHFDDKEGLFRAVLDRLFEHRRELLEAVPQRLDEALVYWFRETVGAEEFLRLLQREALHDSGGDLVREEERREYYGRQIEILRSWQEDGRIAADLDPKYLFLALLALIAYPGTFPTITRLATGHEAGSAEFDRHWTRLLRALADHLTPSLPDTTEP